MCFAGGFFVKKLSNSHRNKLTKRIDYVKINLYVYGYVDK